MEYQHKYERVKHLFTILILYFFHRSFFDHRTIPSRCSNFVSSYDPKCLFIISEFQPNVLSLQMSSRKTIFKIVIILFPIVSLLLFELILRLFSISTQPPLFLEKFADGQAVIQINSNIGERYFNPKTTPVPNLYPQTFKAEKAESTFRIFCLGGSTTAGFPYEMTVPFPQQMAFMLQRDYPEKTFEVINLGLSAVNSFTIVDWIPEILDQDPDLILLYMGHNEFYGAYGTGSTISLGNKGHVVRLILKLQKLHTVQLFKSIARSLSSEPSLESRPTLMEKIIADQSIPPTSGLRSITYQNFEENLDVILNTCQQEGVPVILSNLVSNTMDQKPLDFTSNPNQPSSKAHTLFLKGQKEFAQSDTATARISFTRAMSMDAVPFRAPDAINEVIHQKAQQYNINYVDMLRAFNTNSSSGIPGDQLFSDHLHPNPIGYYLMATEFYRSLRKLSLLPTVPGRKQNPYPLLVTELDWEIGSLTLFKLKQRWPFGNANVDYADYPPSVDAQTTQIAKSFLFDHHEWGTAHGQMAEYFVSTGNLEKACSEYLPILEMYPNQLLYYGKLIDCAREAKFWRLVEHTSKRALKRSQAKGMFSYHLAFAQRMMGDLEQAVININKAALAPELTPAQSTNIQFTQARFLLESQNNMEAILVLEALVKQVPDFAPAQQLLKQLKG